MSTSLDNPIVKKRLLDGRNFRKESRARTLIEAGMMKYTGRNQLKFLTLTSSPDSDPALLSKHYRELKRQLERRHLLREGSQYARVKTDEGNGVLHMITTWNYVDQKIISRLWEKIHGALIVYIETIKKRPRRLRNYLASYLQGQSARISSSRNWIYVGWRKEYRRIGTRLFFHYIPRLVCAPFCCGSYVKKLYYIYKQDILINSLIPLTRP